MKLVKEIKSKKGVVHFRRWRIIELPWFSIYIHGIYKEDTDLHLHNHPWKIWTMILKGGYWEEREVGHRLRTFGHMAYANTKAFHKINKMYRNPTYTLAIVGKRTNNKWGYKTENGFVDHITYRKNKNNGSNPKRNSL